MILPESYPAEESERLPDPLHGELEYEPPVATFREYRELCDTETDSFRHLGLLSPERYLAVLEDKRTVLCDIDGKRIPAIVPIEYEDGYDAERCRRLTQCPEVMLLTAPLSKVAKGSWQHRPRYGKSLSDEVAIVVEEPHREDTDVQGDDHNHIAKEMSGLGRFEPREFIDPRLKDQEGHESAWMGLYSLPVTPTELAKRQIQDAAEMLVPERILDLKVQYDAELERQQAERLSYANNITQVQKEELQNRIVDQYLKAGREERVLLPAVLREDESMKARSGEVREVTLGVRHEIQRLMDLSYEELEASARQAREHPEKVPGYPSRTFEESWDQHRRENGLPALPTADSEEVYAFSSGVLRDNRHIVDRLWAISQQGFGQVLGGYHPVSMEETREFFESQLFADESYTIVRFHHGEPVCFGSLTFDIRGCGWLNTENTTLDQELEEAESQGQVPVLFSEVISGDETKASYATSIFSLATELAVTRRDRPHRILFESTNLSSCYIPRMVERLYDRSKTAHMIDPQRGVAEVDRLDYWYLVVNPGATDE